MFCQVWSRSKLFAKVISRWHLCLLDSTTSLLGQVHFQIKGCLVLSSLIEILVFTANSVDPDQTMHHMHLLLKILNGMANPSGAVWSVSALFAYIILSDTLVFEILGHSLLINPSLAGNKMNQACKRGYLYLRSHYPLNFTSIFMKFSRIICRS